jgi:hypothetical protein
MICDIIKVGEMSNKYLTEIYQMCYNKSRRDEDKARRKPPIPAKIRRRNEK